MRTTVPFETLSFNFPLTKFVFLLRPTILSVGPQQHKNTPIDNMSPRGHNMVMVEIRKTEIFAKWFDGLHGTRAHARILVRIARSAAGNPGDEDRG